MTILTLNVDPLAVDVAVTETMLKVTLEDGRELGVPVEWYPRLRDGSPEARADWRLIGRGEGIHWPELDEDISVTGLLAGYRQTGQTQSCLGRPAEAAIAFTPRHHSTSSRSSPWK